MLRVNGVGWITWRRLVLRRERLRGFAAAAVAVAVSHCRGCLAAKVKRLPPAGPQGAAHRGRACAARADAHRVRCRRVAGGGGGGGEGGGGGRGGGRGEHGGEGGGGGGGGGGGWHPCASNERKRRLGLQHTVGC